MKALIILIGIMLFWFTLGTFIFYYSQDSSLSISQNYTGIDYDAFNQSYDNTNSLSSLGNTFKFMFGFRMPASEMPNGIAAIISSLNWFLFIILIIVIYRLASPFSSG
jgi:magnesium-transporting ATPase (P-type)